MNYINSELLTFSERGILIRGQLFKLIPGLVDPKLNATQHKHMSYP